MSAKKGGFMEKFEFGIMPMVYGLGAAVVIVGALFKIMHWKGADLMLIIGLGTEAVIFACSAFLPVHREYEWERVYPQLKQEFADAPTGPGLAGKLSEMMSSAGVNQDVIGKLGSGLKNLTDSVGGLKDLSNAAVASNEYATNVKTASSSIVEMNKSYSKTVEAMSSMANASVDAKEYHTQVQSITKNLGALNAVYEMELQDANQHIKAMNKFYTNLSSAMDNMAEASKDTAQFKDELGKLTKNLTSLNTVYGGMLTAMKS